jgi:hypothetical protein
VPGVTKTNVSGLSRILLHLGCFSRNELLRNGRISFHFNAVPIETRLSWLLSCFGCPSRMFLPLICAWCAGILQESHNRFFSCANHCSRYLLRLQLCRIGNHPRPVTIHGCSLLTKAVQTMPVYFFRKMRKDAENVLTFLHAWSPPGKKRESEVLILQKSWKTKKTYKKKLFLLI